MRLLGCFLVEVRNESKHRYNSPIASRKISSMADSSLNYSYRPHVIVAGVLLLPYLIPPFAQTALSHVFSLLSHGVAASLALLYFTFVRNCWVPRLKSLPLSFFVLLFALTLVSIILDRDRAIAADFTELAKPFSLALVFSLGYTLSWNQDLLRNYIIRPLVILLALSASLVIIESVPMSWADAVSDVYVRSRGSLQNKAIGPFSTPYFAGSVYVYMALSFLSLYITTKKKSFLALFLLGMLLAILTQSRTVFLAILVSIPVWIGLYLAFHRAIKRQRLNLRKFAFAIVGVFAFSTFALMIYLFLKDNLGYLILGVNTYFLNLPEHLAKDSGSVGVRMSQIRFVIENNPYVLIGAGIGKGYAGSLESFYALYYYRYGILGMAIYSLLWISGLRFSWRSMRYAQMEGKDYWSGFFLGLVAFLMVLPILSLSSVITDQPILYPLFYTLLGIVYSYYFKVVRFGHKVLLSVEKPVASN